MTFADALPNEVKLKLKIIGQSRTYDEGNVVHKGLPGSGYVLVVEIGKLDLYANIVTGKRLLVASFGPGEVVGDFAVIGQSDLTEPQNLSLETSTKAQVLIIPKEAFLKALEANKEALMLLIDELLGKLNAIVIKAGNLGLLSVKARLVHELIRISKLQNLEEERQYRLQLYISHEQLADILGTTRQSITRAFADLRKNGCISEQNRKSLVLDKQCTDCLDSECYSLMF